MNIVITVERGGLSRRSLESGAIELAGDEPPGDTVTVALVPPGRQFEHLPRAIKLFSPQWELFRTAETIDYVNERRRIPKL